MSGKAVDGLYAESNEDLAMVRAKLLDRILYAAVLLGAVLLALGIYLETRSAHPAGVILATYWTLYAGLVLMAFWKGPGYRLRGCVFLLFLYAVGLAELWFYGLSNVSTLFLFAGVMFAGLLFGARAGGSALLLALATLLSVGALSVNGWWVRESQNQGLLPRTYVAWLAPAISLSLISGAILVALTQLLQTLRRHIDSAQELVGKLREQIAGREAAEKILQQSEERFRSLIEYSSDVVLLVEPDGRIAYASPAVEKLHGFPIERVFGASLFEYLHPGDAAAVRALLRQLPRMQFETAHYFECRVKHQDESWRTVEVAATRMQDGSGKLWMVLNYRDVTSRRHAEEERTRLTLAIEQAAEVIVITSVDGTIQYVNPAFESVTGYTRQEALGKNPRLLKSGRHDTAHYQEMWAALLRGETWTGRLVNKRKDGTLFTEEAAISPVRNAAGATVNFVAAMRDITREVELERQLLQAQRMDSIGRLAGGVAHDFNNMLSVIIGHAELALDGTDSNQPLHKDLTGILKAASRSAELTRQLLAFARKQVAMPQILDLNETVQGMIKMLGRLIGENIELVWVPAQNLSPVKLDPSQVDQILANLCVNARDAISGAGRIIIETRNARLDEPYCAAHPGAVPGDYVRLTVSDDGCGMDKDVVEHIFEPFFTTKKTGAGTGLGLATVYGIVKQNGAYINVYSEPNSGSVFTIYFPRFEGAPRRVEPDAFLALPKGRGETILLVEDDPELLPLGETILNRLGYTVLTAQRPRDALSLAEVHRGGIDLLLTDVVMPEMNGRELADRIATIAPGLKSLFTSGYTADVMTRNGFLQEDTHFIQKPASIQNLAHKIHEVLSAP